MTLTPDQIEERRRYLGASDAAAVLGLSPWSSPHDVWTSKVHRLRQDASTATRTGDWLEPALVQRAADIIGGTLVRDVRYVAENGIMASNLDGMLHNDQHPQGASVEAKYRSTRSVPRDSHVSRLTELWGPATGEDDFESIPLDERIQVMHQMLCCRSRVGYVAVALCEFEIDFRLYRIERTPRWESWFKALEAKLCEWWERHIVQGVEPSRERASYDVMRRVDRAEHVTPCVLEQSLFEEYLLGRQREKAGKDAKERAGAAILAAMAAEESNFAQGQGVYAKFSKDGKLLVKEDRLVGVN